MLSFHKKNRGKYFWFLCFSKEKHQVATWYLSAAAILSRDISTDLKHMRTRTHTHTHTYTNTTRVHQLSVCWAMMSRAEFLLQTDPHVSSVQLTTSTPKSGTECIHMREEMMMKWLGCSQTHLTKKKKNLYIFIYLFICIYLFFIFLQKKFNSCNHCNYICPHHCILKTTKE